MSTVYQHITVYLNADKNICRKLLIKRMPICIYFIVYMRKVLALNLLAYNANKAYCITQAENGEYVFVHGNY